MYTTAVVAAPSSTSIEIATIERIAVTSARHAMHSAAHATKIAIGQRRREVPASTAPKSTGSTANSVKNANRDPSCELVAVSPSDKIAAITASTSTARGQRAHAIPTAA